MMKRGDTLTRRDEREEGVEFLGGKCVGGVRVDRLRLATGAGDANRKGGG